MSETLFSKRISDKSQGKSPWDFAHLRTRDSGLCPKNPPRNFLKKVSWNFKNFSENEFVRFFLVKFLKECRGNFFQKVSFAKRPKLSHLAVAADDVFVGVELAKTHRSAGVELLRGDADLTAEPEFTAVGKSC